LQKTTYYGVGDVEYDVFTTNNGTTGGIDATDYEQFSLETGELIEFTPKQPDKWKRKYKRSVPLWQR
jgi:hypothetical protein